MYKATNLIITIYLLLVFIPVGLTSALVGIDQSEMQPAYQIEHARELLASRSPASLKVLEGKVDVGSFVREYTEGTLQPIWRKQTERISRALISESNKYQMDPLLLIALIEHESYFNPTTVGRHGEIGLMQIKPSTAQWIAKLYRIPFNADSELFDPVVNIKIGTAYLSYLRDKLGPTPEFYISAYNMGPKNLRTQLEQQNIPHIYLGKVMAEYLDLYEELKDYRESDAAEGFLPDIAFDQVTLLSSASQKL